MLTPDVIARCRDVQLPSYAQSTRLVADRDRESRAHPAPRAPSVSSVDREREPAQPAPREPKPSPGATASRNSVKQPLGREPVRQLPPEVEGALALEVGEHLAHAVAAALVGGDALGDRVLRPGQRRDPGVLDRREDPDAHVVGEQVEAGDDLGVADDEPEPPAGHPVGLRHREHLDADLLRARLGEKRLRRAPVEDEVAVGEVVDDRRAGVVRVGDREREGPGRRADRAGVGGVVQEDGGDVLAGRLAEVGPPAGAAVERHVAGLSRRERRPGGVVGVVGVGQHDRRPALSEHERELADRSLRPRHDRDLGVRVELDSVERGVASRNRLAQRRQPTKRRVPVRGGVVRRRSERVDDVLRRPDLRIPAPKIDERLPVERSVLGNAREQRGEVLLRKR